MTRVLDGKQVAKEMRAEVAREVEAMVAAGARPPGLTTVLIGDDPASGLYVRSKVRASRRAGLEGAAVHLEESTSQDELLAVIDRLNTDDSVDGILVQLPLPDHIDKNEVLERIDPLKDVDGFHPTNVGRLWLDQPAPGPATAVGVVELLKRSEIPLEGASAVIVGRSAIVGKPLAGLLMRENCTVTVCHSRTRELARVCQGADILVAAIGRTAFVGPEFVTEGTVVIDVGINRVTDPEEAEHLFPGDEARREQFERKGSIVVGDVDYFRVAPIAAAITPVPGGVGPLTIAQLLRNTLATSRHRQGLDAPEAGSTT
jgi:methylenetetrahydrofolate dehydrogenase (NADP+)/methenyltetrahydrofolate cyclohydrolase